MTTTQPELNMRVATMRRDWIDDTFPVACLLARNAEKPHHNTVHGHNRRSGKSKEYQAWRGAKDRCYNPNSNRYKTYGARGIRMCEEWRNSFAAFFRDMGERPDGHSIDRINNDGHYEPGNCRWSPKSEQAKNQTRTRALELKGVRKILADWSRDTGIHHTVILSRIDRLGWSVEKALTTPVRKQCKSSRQSANGRKVTLWRVK